VTTVVVPVVVGAGAVVADVVVPGSVVPAVEPVVKTANGTGPARTAAADAPARPRQAKSAANPTRLTIPV
jgi:hypothetical protein